MKLYLVMSPGRRLVPASDEDRAKLRAFRPGDMLPVRVTKPRNGDHTRKFFALLRFVAEHHPRMRSTESLLIELKMLTGHYDHYIRQDTGEVVYMPKSISFDEMDEGDFIVWSAQARELIFSRFIPELTSTKRDRARFEHEIEQWLAWN